MQKIYNYLTEEFGPSSFIRGLNYNSSYVRLLKTEINEEEKDLFFKVKSERKEDYYNVWISANINKEEIEDYKKTIDYQLMGKLDENIMNQIVDFLKE